MEIIKLKIRDAKGRKDKNSAYMRVFNNIALGALISKIQATVISNGSELERIILSQTNNIKDLNTFISNAEIGDVADGIYVCNKPVLKKSSFAVEDKKVRKELNLTCLFLLLKKDVFAKLLN